MGPVSHTMIEPGGVSSFDVHEVADVPISLLAVLPLGVNVNRKVINTKCAESDNMDLV
jgi:hypothetical protein